MEYASAIVLIYLLISIFFGSWCVASFSTWYKFNKCPALSFNYDSNVKKRTHDTGWAYSLADGFLCAFGSILGVLFSQPCPNNLQSTLSNFIGTPCYD